MDGSSLIDIFWVPGKTVGRGLAFSMGGAVSNVSDFPLYVKREIAQSENTYRFLDSGQ